MNLLYKPFIGRLTALIFFISISFSSASAQDCGCTVSQVMLNTVVPCTTTIGTEVIVSTVSEFYAAVAQANNSGGNMTILFEDGIYPVASTAQYPYITASNVVFRSLSGNRDAVILTGQGMVQDYATEIGIFAVGDNITIADLTIREVGNHAIAVTGDGLVVHNVRLQDSYEQMIKGNNVGDGADNGLVQCSLFEYTAGIGPQFYIGGLDIHAADDWVVRDNIFKDIASPSITQAEHAIHFWQGGSNELIERNVIIGCDRGIGLGLGDSPNVNGVIKNNTICNDGSDLFDDVGIGLESSPGTQVLNNTVVIDYQNAIEYRFESTTDAIITNNLCNRTIASRNGGMAILTTNYEEAENAWFVDVTTGDLRLATDNVVAVDQGSTLPSVIVDLDHTIRPQGAGFDLGAHEWPVAGCPEDFNSDGVVSVNDFLLYNSVFGQECVDCPEDLDGNGLIGVNDFLLFNSAFGVSCE